MVKKKIEGYPMYLPFDHGIGKRLYLYGGREFAFMWLLRKEASGVALDVGANIGYCTLSLASRCEKVYAYEPDPRSFKVLQKNVKLNKFKNVETRQELVLDYSGEAGISLAKKPNLSSIHGDGNRITVPCRELAEHIPEANFIKMDIEGAEVTVLRGALDVLAEAKNMKILVEVHPKQYNADNDFVPVLRALLEHGYQFKYVVNAKGKIREFRDCECVKTFKQYKERAVFANVPDDRVVKWATEMPEDGKKFIRSILLCKST